MAKSMAADHLNSSLSYYVSRFFFSSPRSYFGNRNLRQSELTTYFSLRHSTYKIGLKYNEILKMQRICITFYVPFSFWAFRTRQKLTFIKEKLEKKNLRFRNSGTREATTWLAIYHYLTQSYELMNLMMNLGTSQLKHWVEETWLCCSSEKFMKL